MYLRSTEEQPSVVPSICELFDFGYEQALELMGDAVEMCGPETAIISYSDHDIDVYLFCYLVFKGEAKWIKIHCETTIVTDCIKQLWGNRGKSHSVPTLEQLVDNAVNAIQATNPGRETTGESKVFSTKNSIDLLSILHSVLIKPILIDSVGWCPDVKKMLDRCINLVISPQGFLTKVPSAPSTIKSKKNFSFNRRLSVSLCTTALRAKLNLNRHLRILSLLLLQVIQYQWVKKSVLFRVQPEKHVLLRTFLMALNCFQAKR